MSLFKLELKTDKIKHLPLLYQYEIIIRAPSPFRARRIAGANACQEGFDVWQDPKKTSCTKMKEPPEEVISRQVYNPR